MKAAALIMAGGRGERFWPESRRSMPKQFLPVVDKEKTMIQLTAERILPLVSPEDIFVVTCQKYRELVRQQLPFIPEENILCEPIGRSTAPCVGLGAAVIEKRYGEAMMLVLPSDHLVRHEDMFLRTIRDGMEAARQGSRLVTVGITPSRPETGYGYIRFSPGCGLERVYKVENFVEKPEAEAARAYLDSGEYLWNSGMFLWKTSSILKNIQLYMPTLYEGIRKIQEAAGSPEQEAVLKKEYEKMASISVDYGIMEKAKEIYTVPGSFGWDDVGSWLSAAKLYEADGSGNCVQGTVVTLDTSGCILKGQKRLIAAIGLSDVAAVDTEDALLLCSMDRIKDIRMILEILEERGMEKYL